MLRPLHAATIASVVVLSATPASVRADEPGVLAACRREGTLWLLAPGARGQPEVLYRVVESPGGSQPGRWVLGWTTTGLDALAPHSPTANDFASESARPASREPELPSDWALGERKLYLLRRSAGDIIVGSAGALGMEIFMLPVVADQPLPSVGTLSPVDGGGVTAGRLGAARGASTPPSERGLGALSATTAGQPVQLVLSDRQLSAWRLDLNNPRDTRLEPKVKVGNEEFIKPRLVERWGPWERTAAVDTDWTGPFWAVMAGDDLILGNVKGELRLLKDGKLRDLGRVVPPAGAASPQTPGTPAAQPAAGAAGSAAPGSREAAGATTPSGSGTSGGGGGWLVLNDMDAQRVGVFDTTAAGQVVPAKLEFPADMPAGVAQRFLITPDAKLLERLNTLRGAVVAARREAATQPVPQPAQGGP